MTANISDNAKAQFLTPERRFDLMERLTGATELDVLLDLFGEEVEKLGLGDGYLINLRDADTENLISVKVHFTPEYQFLDETYFRYKVQLVDDSINVSARAFLSRGIIQCDAVSGTDKEKQLLALWKLSEIAAIAILDDDDFSQQPIGTFLLLKQEGHIDEQMFVVLEQLISVFYRPLRNALEYSFLKEHRDRVQAAVAEHSRFLEFMVEMNNLASSEAIYPMFAAELFGRFAFDGAGFFLLENGALINKKVMTANPLFEDIGNEWEKYLQDKPYLLDTTDGGISHTFLRNIPLMFQDVQTIINLPMSEKDRQTLRIMKTARTLLMTPVCHRNKPIGVLMFYSLAGLVEMTDADLNLVRHLSSFFGTAYMNCTHYGSGAGRTDA